MAMLATAVLTRVWRCLLRLYLPSGGARSLARSKLSSRHGSGSSGAPDQGIAEPRLRLRLWLRRRLSLGRRLRRRRRRGLRLRLRRRLRRSFS
eukprot:scaffold78436_cov69-Phaeocystis_antarctica.AAC.2